VRHVYSGDTSWHKANDNLEGTSQYGNILDDNVKWSIEYRKDNFDTFLFAHGNFKNWIIMTSDAAINGSGDNDRRPFLKSSQSETAGTMIG
jgi:hypothetical protein